jgi:hypothetical protein
VKYVEAYLAALYDVLEKGGKQEVVDAAISEVNNPTDAGLKKWLVAFPDQRCDCGASFKPESVTLDQEMSCPTCSKKISA